MDQSQPPINLAPTGSVRSTTSKWLWVSLIIVILVAGGYFGWYYLLGPGKKVVTSNSTITTTITTTAPATITPTTKAPTTSSSDSSTDIQSAQQIANQFMSDQVAVGKDTTTQQLTAGRSNVLEMFTPAQTSAEQTDLAFLAGTDIQSSTAAVKYPSARILCGTAGLCYTITSFTLGAGSESNQVVTFPVTEIRNSWTGSAYVNTTITNYINLIKVNGSWEIDQYYVKDFTSMGNTLESAKYSAF